MLAERQQISVRLAALAALIWAIAAPASALATPGEVVEFEAPTLNASVSGITAGPDGNMWFSEYDGNKIGRISPTGQITEFAVPRNEKSSGQGISRLDRTRIFGSSGTT